MRIKPLTVFIKGFMELENEIVTLNSCTLLLINVHLEIKA